MQTEGGRFLNCRVSASGSVFCTSRVLNKRKNFNKTRSGSRDVVGRYIWNSKLTLATWKPIREINIQWFAEVFSPFELLAHLISVQTTNFSVFYWDLHGFQNDLTIKNLPSFLSKTAQSQPDCLWTAIFTSTDSESELGLDFDWASLTHVQALIYNWLWT